MGITTTKIGKSLPASHLWRAVIELRLAVRRNIVLDVARQ